jgi:hypothetical protein
LEVTPVDRSTLERIVREELRRKVKSIVEKAGTVTADEENDDEKDVGKSDIGELLKGLEGEDGEKGGSDPLADLGLGGADEQEPKPGDDPDGDGVDEAEKAAKKQEYDDSDIKAVEKTVKGAASEVFKNKQIKTIKEKNGSDEFPGVPAREIVIELSDVKEPVKIIAVAKGGKVELHYSVNGTIKNSLDK